MPKINYNGIVREMTADELAEYQRMQSEMPPPDPTPDERMAALEAALLELGALLGGG